MNTPASVVSGFESLSTSILSVCEHLRLWQVCTFAQTEPLLLKMQCKPNYHVQAHIFYCNNAILVKYRYNSFRYLLQYLILYSLYYCWRRCIYNVGGKAEHVMTDGFNLDNGHFMFHLYCTFVRDYVYMWGKGGGVCSQACFRLGFQNRKCAFQIGGV